MLDLFPSHEAGPFGRRLKRERGARVPVTVVTGFLGAQDHPDPPFLGLARRARYGGDRQ
jgi:hypothetical protein